MLKLYSKEAEESLLGLFLKDEKTFIESHSILSDNDFFIDQNRLIFASIRQAFADKKTTNPIIVVNYLNESSDSTVHNDWFKILSRLMVISGFKPELNEYINEVKEKAQIRKLQATLKDSINYVSVTEKPIKNLIETIETKIFSVTKERKLKDFFSINELTTTFAEKLIKIEQDGYTHGLKTSISTLDEKVGAFKPGDFIIIAARPSMGKTAFALEIAKNVAKEKNVALFSLEMPNEQLIQRLVTSEAMVNFLSIENKKYFNQNQNNLLDLAFDKIRNLQLWIDDSPTAKIGEICWKARKLHSIQNLDLIIIDYLQLIEAESSRENRQQSVSEISRTLKALARELAIPVIALSQLSRRVESRENKRPQMSDIRESGAIEQDADIIMFLYREDYYNNEKTTDIQDLEVIISKHRNGPTGIIKLKFHTAFGKINTYEL